MDIFTVIKKDHRAVQKLLSELTSTHEKAIKRRESLLTKIKEELLPHNRAEEKIFYPRLNRNREQRLMMYEGFDEHGLGKEVLDELMEMDKSTEEWAAKAKVLNDLINHHIEEEEGEIHPAAKKILSKEEAKALGVEFEDLKEEMKKEPEIEEEKPEYREVS